MFPFPSTFVVTVAVVLFAFTPVPALADDQAQAAPPPVADMLPRDIRYWNPDFKDTRVPGSYPSLTWRDGTYELWNTGHDWVLVDGRLDMEVNRLTRQRGVRLDALEPPETLVRLADLIDDVAEPDDPARPATGRSWSRQFVTHVDGIGYVGLVCVYPEFGVHLHPALIVSTTGEPGDWRYLGQLTGEPAEEAARRRVWSDGGAIFRLKDGRWRIYLNGYADPPGAVSALEADQLAGPWRFLRDEHGAIRALAPGAAAGPDPATFPNVLRVADNEWHLWLSNRWQPTQIWHYFSEDGLDFRPYGRQPEIERGEDQPAIKNLRAFLSADGRHIVGLLSVWDTSARPAMWRLYTSSLPVGPVAGVARPAAE